MTEQELINDYLLNTGLTAFFMSTLFLLITSMFTRSNLKRRSDKITGVVTRTSKKNTDIQYTYKGQVYTHATTWEFPVDTKVDLFVNKEKPTDVHLAKFRHSTTRVYLGLFIIATIVYIIYLAVSTA